MLTISEFSLTGTVFLGLVGLWMYVVEMMVSFSLPLLISYPSLWHYRASSCVVYNSGEYAALAEMSQQLLDSTKQQFAVTTGEQHNRNLFDECAGG